MSAPLTESRDGPKLPIPAIPSLFSTVSTDIDTCCLCNTLVLAHLRYGYAPTADESIALRAPAEASDFVRLYVVGQTEPLDIPGDDDGELGDGRATVRQFAWNAEHLSSLDEPMAFEDADGDLIVVRPRNLVAAVMPIRFCEDMRADDDESSPISEGGATTREA